MPYQLPPEPSTRRTRIVGWVTFAVAAVFVALAAYFAYVGYEGSRQLTEAPAPSTDCRTPASLGWRYEAVNYDIGGDAALAEEPDPLTCSRQGPRARGRVTSSDGVRLAAWYVPAGNGSGPTGPTVVIVHGWGSNKSAMIDRAAVLHDEYNLLIPDLRNHGQSGRSATTQGVREALDLRAMLDWLEREKGPGDVAVIGVSMGGATALAEAGRDARVDALVVESTHATLANAIQARLDQAGYPFSLPGSWAILLGALLRTGEDASSVDPVQAIETLDRRPVLLLYGDADPTIGPDDPDLLRAAAEAAEAPVELVICTGAGHAMVPDVCPERYRESVLGFLGRTLGSP